MLKTEMAANPRLAAISIKRAALSNAVGVFSAASVGGYPWVLAEVSAFDIPIPGIHFLPEAIVVRFVALVGRRHLAGHSRFLLGTPRQGHLSRAFCRHFGVLLESLGLTR